VNSALCLNWHLPTHSIGRKHHVCYDIGHNGTLRCTIVTLSQWQTHRLRTELSQSVIHGGFMNHNPFHLPHAVGTQLQPSVTDNEGDPGGASLESFIYRRNILPAAWIELGKIPPTDRKEYPDNMVIHYNAIPLGVRWQN